MPKQEEKIAVVASTVEELKTFLFGCKDDIRIAPDPLSLWLEGGMLHVDFTDDEEDADDSYWL